MKITPEQKNILQAAAAQLKKKIENRQKQQDALTAINEFSKHVGLMYSNKLDPTPEEIEQYFNYCLSKVQEAKDHFASIELPTFKEIKTLLDM